MAAELRVDNTEGHSEFIWREGKIIPWEEATVHVNAVGHASVSAVFEGMRAYWNADKEQLYVFRLAEHVERFLQSTKLVRLAVSFSGEQLLQGVLELLRANQYRQDTEIRLWNFAKGYIQHPMLPPDWPAEVVIDMWPFQSKLLSGAEGARVCVSSWQRIGDSVMPPRIKAFSNYHNGRMAQMEAQLNGYDWPLLLNERGKITEGPGACLGIVRGGKLITPEVTSGVLESVTRDTVLQTAPELFGIPVVEREIDRTELYTAEEAFYMGTAWEVWPIIEVDRLPVGDGKPGRVGGTLERGYHDLVRGIDPRKEEWRRPVW